MRGTLSGHTAISFTRGEQGAVRYRNGSAAYYDALAAYFPGAAAASRDPGVLDAWNVPR